MAARPMQTLPGRDCHAPEVFDIERERVFARNWVYAGRADALSEPGDFLTVDVAGESVIVVCGNDGDLRGFYNVCRHRGSRLRDEVSGRMKGAVKCTYHAWAYSFEGSPNWRIVIENDNECLHGPTVHPELVQVVPAFRKRAVFDESREDGGGALAGGGTSFTANGRSRFEVLPGLDEHDATCLYGCTFRPEAIADPGFDPSEIVDFVELVAHQGYVVFERVQRGVRSRAFTHGVLITEKDSLLDEFNARYLAERGPVG
jgi:phenylpropionate dioxygenase-like ring-hydroxylating dioxygenase large terminal subunit